MAVDVKSSWAELGSFVELGAANSRLKAMQRQLAEANDLQRQQLLHQIETERRAAAERARYADAKQTIFEERKRAETILGDPRLTAGQKCTELLGSWAMIAPIGESDFEDFRDKEYIRETRDLVRKGIEAFPDHALLATRGIVDQRVDLIRRVRIAMGYAEALERYRVSRKSGGKVLPTVVIVLLLILLGPQLIFAPLVPAVLLLVIGLPVFLFWRARKKSRFRPIIETARADFARAIERHRAFQAEDPSLPDPIAMPPFGPDYTGADLVQELADLYRKWGAQEGRFELAEADLMKRSPEALAGIEPAPHYALTSAAGLEAAMLREHARQHVIERRLMEKYDDPIHLMPRTDATA